MQQDDCVWHLPRLSARLQLGVRLAMLFVLALTLLWLISAWHGAWQQRTFSVSHGVLSMLILLMWMPLWQRLYVTVSQMNDSTLLWLEDPARPRHAPKTRYVRCAKATHVRLLFDAGHHLLIHVHHATGHDLHWVPDANVPLVWRWRLAARNTAPWHYLAHD